MNRLTFWFCDHFGQRDEIKSYEGHGNFSEERGWWLFGRWVSYDNPPNTALNQPPIMRRLVLWLKANINLGGGGSR